MESPWTPAQLEKARRWQKLVNEMLRSGNNSATHPNMAEIRLHRQELDGELQPEPEIPDPEDPAFVPDLVDALLAFVEQEALVIESLARRRGVPMAGVAETRRMLRDPDAEFIAYIQTLAIGEELPPQSELEHFGSRATLARRLQRLSHPVTGWVKKSEYGKYVRRR